MKRKATTKKKKAAKPRRRSSSSIRLLLRRLSLCKSNRSGAVDEGLASSRRRCRTNRYRYTNQRCQPSNKAARSITHQS